LRQSGKNRFALSPIVDPAPTCLSYNLPSCVCACDKTCDLILFPFLCALFPSTSPARLAGASILEPFAMKLVRRRRRRHLNINKQRNDMTSSMAFGVHVKNKQNNRFGVSRYYKILHPILPPKKTKKRIRSSLRSGRSSCAPNPGEKWKNGSRRSRQPPTRNITM
jgi:hypothetical protein